MDKQQHIEEIMDWFDFNRVAKVMKLLDWKWASTVFGVPCEGQIREHVRKNLSEVYDKATGQGREYEIQTGGFSYIYDPREDYMKLSFKISEWETNIV